LGIVYEEQNMPVAVVYKTATIPAGQWLSSVIDCSAGAPIMIHIPEWTAACLSFQVSPDGTNFYDWFDRDTVEIVVNVVEGTCVPLDPEWAAIQFFRLRSGLRDLPVPQQADRQIVITLDTSPPKA
jgi:hypothetical protein